MHRQRNYEIHRIFVQKNDISAVEKVQRNAARRVMGKVKKWRNEIDKIGKVVKIHDSVTGMIQNLGWESLEVRRKRDRLCNMYRVVSGSSGWGEIRHKIEGGSYKGRNDHAKKLQRKHGRTDVGRWSFLNRTIREWNELSEEVVSAGSVGSFRAMLKKCEW